MFLNAEIVFKALANGVGCFYRVASYSLAAGGTTFFRERELALLQRFPPCVNKQLSVVGSIRLVFHKE